MLDDGEELPATRVVVAAGVRPEVSLARAAGLPVQRGIVVDDALRAGAPSVWAVGECAEHRGVVYGLWSPLAEQARVAGAGVAGDPAAFHGAVQATTLKVSGVDVYAGGASAGAAPAGHDEIVLSDTRSGIYRRLVLDGERLTGAALVGDVSAARRLSELLRTGDAGPVGPARRRPRPGASAEALAADPRATLCSCNAVTRRRGADRDPPRRAEHRRAGRAAHARDDGLRRLHRRRPVAARARSRRDARVTAVTAGSTSPSRRTAGRAPSWWLWRGGCR